MAVAGIVASLAIAVPVFAQGPSTMMKGGNEGGMRADMVPGVSGTVSAVNGTTLTVTSRSMRGEWANGTSTKARMGTATTTVYTVNASAATVYKNGATSTISGIATGDTVMVEGTVVGTNVTATIIRDGMAAGKGSGKDSGRDASSTFPTSTSLIQGNGEPVIGGNITAISGTALTVTNASNITYSVDASKATIVKGGATSTIANLAVGDSVVVQGTVNNTSVTAASVIDQGAKDKNSSSTESDKPASHGGFGGFFGAIGGFFSHLFGF